MPRLLITLLAVVLVLTGCGLRQDPTPGKNTKPTGAEKWFTSTDELALADPDAREAVTGSTPLAKACLPRDVDVFTALMEAGADPDAARQQRRRRHHTCARTNAGDLILLMLEHGADPLATNSGGASFQEYYFSYPKDALNDHSPGERAAIIAWARGARRPSSPAASCDTASLARGTGEKEQPRRGGGASGLRIPTPVRERN